MRGFYHPTDKDSKARGWLVIDLAVGPRTGSEKGLLGVDSRQAQPIFFFDIFTVKTHMPQRQVQYLAVNIKKTKRGKKARPA